MEAALALLPSAVCIPVSIYGNIKLYRHRKEMFVRKRSIVFGLNISIVSAMCFITFARMGLYLGSTQAMTLGICLYFSAWWLFLFCIVTKNWMIFFKYKWTYYTLESKWQQLINPNTAKIKNKKNWFICNNTKYGNLLYMSKLFGLLHFIGFILCAFGVILRTTNKHTASLIIGGAACVLSSLLPPIVFYVLIICKTPNFEDIFYMHKESKLHAKLLIVLAIAYIAVNIILSISHSFSKTLNVAAPSFTLTFFLMNYVSTFFIIRKNKHSKNDITQEIAEYNLSEINLHSVLSNAKALNLFIIHLSKEFNMECLLSYIEFSQFQQFVIKCMDERECKECNDTLQQIGSFIKFPRNVPMSIIIETENSAVKTKLDDIKLKAHELYNKYAASGSEFEINLKHNHRNELVRVLSYKKDLMENDNITPKDIIMLFNGPTNEMDTLLNYSFARYKRENEYHQIVQIFYPQLSPQSNSIININSAV